MPGAVNRGRRVDESVEPEDLELWDYSWDGTNLWFRVPSVRDPEDHYLGIGHMSIGDGWTIVEEADGTITVDPSIWHDKSFGGWHGYLERGVWRAVG